MNTKTMEGLVGARTNMDLLNTPFRVYKEARRRGDTATMERAMGYAAEFSDRADEYQAKADKGMKEDAEEAREKAKLEREKAIQKRREEREKIEEKKMEERIENKETDTLNVSNNTIPDNAVSINAKADKQSVLYTKAGEVSQPEQTTNISISV